MKWLALLLPCALMIGCSNQPKPAVVSAIPGQVQQSTPDVPIYPGAKIKGQASQQQGSETHITTMLTTGDSASKVAAFYSDLLKNPSTSKNGVFLVEGVTPSKSILSVTIQTENGETKITTNSIVKNSSKT